MNTKFSTKFNLFDILFGSISLFIAVLSLIIGNMYKKSDATTIEIQLKNEVIMTIDYSSIDTQTSIILTKEEYPSLLGDVTILIDPSKGVCVDEVTCPNHNCEKQGWVNMVGYPIVCLPNKLTITMTSNDNSSIDIWS